MAPPRLQYLNASRQIVKMTSGARSMFSTSQVRPVDNPPRPNGPSAADLLASLGSDALPPRPSPSRDPFVGSIKLPRHNARPAFPSAVTPSGNSGAAARIGRLIANSNNQSRARQEAKRAPGQTSISTADEMAKHKLAQDLSKQITRRWKAGDVYAPHDLSSVEMAKWKNRGRPMYDVFDVLDFKPAEHYRNFSIMSEYMTPMGRIKHSNETGLRPVNQRRIARAIRRSIGMGMMPSVHRHPEILQKQLERNEQLSAFRTGPM